MIYLNMGMIYGLIHIGYHKTASTWLQNIYLIMKQVVLKDHFPEEIRDKLILVSLDLMLKI